MAADLSLVIRATDHASGVLDDIGKKASGAGHMLGNVLKAGALGAAVGLGALAVASVGFVSAASNLEEATNKANVVFGDAAKAIQDFADTSAESLGIAEVDALSYAATLGTILKGSGLTEDASADMSQKLVTLAADMASFNNIPIDEALEKIRAGLVGESEPLRTVGVLLSETAVAAEAYATGIAAVGSKLTDQQKVQARYSLILKQTVDTQGDFARTSGSLANQQRILGAEWKNIQGIIGNALLPTVTKLFQFLTKFLTEHEDDIQRIVAALSVWVEEAIPKVLDALKPIAEWFKEKIPPIIDAVTNFAEDAWPKVVSALEDAWDEIRPLLEKLEELGDWFTHNKEAMTAAAVGIGAAMATAFTIWAITAGAAAVATILAAAPVLVLMGVVALLAAGIFLLIKHWDEVTKWVKEHQTAILAIAGVFMILFPPLGILIALVALAIKHWDEVSWVINHVVIPAFNAVASFITGTVIPAVSAIAGFLTGTLWPAFNSIVSVISDVVIAIQNVLLVAFDAVKGAANSMLGVVSKPFNQAKSAVKQLIEWIDKLIKKVSEVDWPSLPDPRDLPFVPGGANGLRAFRGGWAMVGERGPELVHLARGTDVFSNAQSRSMMAGDGTLAPKLDLLIGASFATLDVARSIMFWVANLAAIRQLIASMYVPLIQIRAFLGALREYAREANPGSYLSSFQHGGFIPAGTVTRALLHGPEYVIPANRMGGGVTVNLSIGTLGAGVTRSHVRDLVDMVEAETRDRRWRHG